jgi:hypothetical protein
MSDKRYLESESLKEAMWKNFYKEEDKWERTPEADFLDVHGGCPRHWFQLGFSAGLDAVVKADAVPHEMSAREYLYHRNRICHARYAERQDDDEFLCEKCVLKEACAPSGEAAEISKSIAIVEKWAQEHPERRSE